MRHLIRILILSLTLGACGTPAQPVVHTPPKGVKEASAAKAIAPKPKILAGPQQLATQSGATLEIPAEMKVSQQGARLQLLDPDGEAEIHLLELKERDLEQALRKAWKQIDPGFAGTVHRRLQPPVSGKFDEALVINYVPDADRRMTQALARRKGTWCWVALIRGPIPALSKRSAQIQVFLASLKPGGSKEEDLTDRTPLPFAKIEGPLREFIAQAMQKSGTPGLAIAAVQGGKVVFSEGFGVRELGKPAKVTDETLMMIGSVSKSLTTLMTATAVDDNKLGWEQKARSIDGRFGVKDAKLAEQLTLEQLFCACAGLPRKDLPLILNFAKKSPANVLTELQQMAPTTKLRETFQYQNHMVAAGGYLAAHALYPKLELGKAYDRAMQERIFKPLKMKSTTLSFRAALRAKNHATAHSQDLKAQHHLFSQEHERFVRFIRPSGGIWTNVRDMANVLLLELGDGVAPDGKRLVSAKNLKRRRQPKVKISAQASYGLGWAIKQVKGLTVITHGGGTMGFATKLSFIPEKGVGVIMISNGTGGHLAEGAIEARLFELMFQVDLKAQQLLDFRTQQLGKEIAELETRLSVPQPGWYKPLLGKHHNPEIGTITIRPRKGGLVMDAGLYSTELKAYQRPDGKTVLLFTKPPLAGLELMPLSNKDGATLRMTRGQEKYLFNRQR